MACDGHGSERQMDDEPGHEGDKQTEPDDQRYVPSYPAAKIVHRDNRVNQSRRLSLIEQSLLPCRFD